MKVCLSLSAVAADPTIAELFSRVQSVRVVGGYAFCASEAGLVIYDITDRTNPRRVSQLFLSKSGSFKVDVSGSYAYVLSGTIYLEKSYLHVIDISNPLSPRLVAEYSDLQPTMVRDMVVVGSHLVIANANMVDILDVSEAQQPRKIAGLKIVEPPGQVVSLFLQSPTLFVCWQELQGGGVASVNIANISNPQRTADYRFNEAPDTMSGVLNSLYVVLPLSGVAVLNTLDSRQIVPTATLSFGRAASTSVFAQDHYLFVGLFNQRKSQQDVALFNIQAPLSPKLIHRFDSVVGTVSGMDFDGEQSHAFLPWYEKSGNGLAIQELNPAGDWKPLGRALVPSISDVAVSSGITFVAGGDALWALESSHGHFQILGKVSFPKYAIRLQIEDQRAFITVDTRTQPLLPEIYVVDISDPQNMRIVGSASFKKLGHPYSSSFDVAGTNVYIAAPEGLYIYDVSNPYNFKQIGYFPTPDFVDQVLVRTGTAYLSTIHLNPNTLIRRIDLYLVDVRNASEPFLKGKLMKVDHADFTNDIEMEGSRLYMLVAGPGYGLGVVGDAKLLAIDVGNFAFPHVLFNVPTNPSRNGYGMQLSVKGKIVYVADGLDGVSILSVKQDPKFLRSFSTPGFANALWIGKNGKLTVADSSSLLVYKTP